VVFYCHFPDKLLASGEFIDEEEDSIPVTRLETSSTSRPQSATSLGAANRSTARPPKPTSLLKALYRLPMDYLEERTTAAADLILVNSLFTSRVFKRYFPTIKLDIKGMNFRLKKNASGGDIGEATGGPRVVYPGINLATYDMPVDSSAFGDENTKDLIS